MKPINYLRHASIFLVALCMAASLTAQNKIANSVIGSGGTPTSGNSNRIVGTLGQAVVGQTTSPANEVKSGFWQQTSDLVTSVEEISTEAIPTEFRLEQNYPNPFNPTTQIRYEIPEAAKVKLTVYNLLGKQVRTLVDEQTPAGTFAVSWDGLNALGVQVASGVYLYRMEVKAAGSGTFVALHKMLLLR